MKNLINLNSQEWCDIIFDKKNKAYGAYAMRQTSAQRHLLAFGITLFFTALISALPSIINTVKAATNKTGGISTTYVASNIPVEKKEIIEVLEPKIPEPPKYAKTIDYRPPVIEQDDKVDPDKILKTTEEVTNSNAQVGVIDVPDGSTDPDAVVKREVEQVTGQGSGGGTSSNKPIMIAEIMPQFPGGEQEMYKFVGDNMKYPVVDQEGGIQGRVTIRFVVSKTGEIKDVEVLRGISPSCDKEAIRVIKNMPRWIPGRQNGIPVAVYFTIPVVFKLKI